MIAQSDDTLVDWLYNIEAMNAGDFLKNLAQAALRADPENYAILRPALLAIKDKYPKYAVPYTGIAGVRKR